MEKAFDGFNRGVLGWVMRIYYVGGKPLHGISSVYVKYMSIVYPAYEEKSLRVSF